MFVNKTLTIVVLLSLSLTSCVNKKQEKQKLQECNKTWFYKVESRLPTGDEHGHGPDVGSDEWKNVVEHRIGIKGNNIVPKINSKEWCEYIDRILFRNENK